MKISKSSLTTIIREVLKNKSKYLLAERESTGRPDVDKVALYLDAITEREEMLLAIPLMFRKIMAYEEHNLTVSEFHDILKSTFDDDDANILFTLLSKATLEAVEDNKSDGEEKEKEQDSKDREDEELGEDDKKASDHKDDDDKDSQSLSDRRRESAAAKRKLRGENLTKGLSEAIIQKALRRALRGK